MSRLPLLLSVPHAGWRVPSEVQSLCRLSPQELDEDGDVGAREIYDLAGEVEWFETTEIARAIVDLNRAEADRRRDGVVKTHTCWNIPVYDSFPDEATIEQLLERYWRPYHESLSSYARQPEEGQGGGAVPLGVDCHTMAAEGPPVGPDPGETRPQVCLGNLGSSEKSGPSCPPEWSAALLDGFRQEFAGRVTLNDPFRGGYIVQAHHPEMPWIQLELSRDPFLSNQEKRTRVLGALQRFCRQCL